MDCRKDWPIGRSLRMCRVALERTGRFLTGQFSVYGIAISAAVLALFSALLVWHGTLLIGLMLNDFFLLTEISYRVAHGELPGYQFTNPMGIFAFGPQAFVFNLTGDMVLAVLTAQVFYAAVVLGFACYISWTRLNQATGLAIAVMLSILMLSPWALGSAVSSPLAAQSTTGMFYNRFGFIVVTLAAMFAIAPLGSRASQAARYDAPVAALMAVLAYYSKVPFGLAVICLFSFWHLVVSSRLDILKRFGLWILAYCIVFELIYPGVNWGYLKEQALAGNVAGSSTSAVLFAQVFSAFPKHYQPRCCR